MKSAQKHLRHSYPGKALVKHEMHSMCMCCMKTWPVAGAPEVPL